MSPGVKRPLVVLLASHWVSMLGVALATTAGLSWLFVLPQQLGGRASNPYVGILAFLAIPAVLFLGLILIPIGIALARHHVVGTLSAVPDRRAAWRRIGLFVGLITFANILIGSQATYRAVSYMETDQFCGQSCHVMKPEFTAWGHAPHSHVQCVECHIAPGAEGWFTSKMNGSKQLIAVVTDSYPKPLEGAIESNKLVSATLTCEKCHNRDREIGDVMRVKTSFKDDEKNSRIQTVLMMQVGGKAKGIHGAHMGPGVEIRYAAADAKRDKIPWVEYKGADGSTRTYVDTSAKVSNMDALPRHTMECTDCHNRPAHSFELAADAVDEALASGALPVSMPFLKKNAVDILTRSQSDAEIPTRLAQAYGGKQNDAVAKVLTAIYDENVFPDLKVTWGTYPNNMGHTDAPGCFRCHDGGHVTADKKEITQDCGACHRTIAVDEASPEVLKTLGLN